MMNSSSPQATIVPPPAMASSSVPSSNISSGPMQPSEQKEYLISSKSTFQDRARMALDIYDRMAKWHLPLPSAPTEDPQLCGLACCCPWCIAYQQRRELLAFTNEENSFCLKDSLPRSGGCCSDPYYPPFKGWPANWPMQPEPEVLSSFQPKICCEVGCCLPVAMYANRSLMKHRFHVIESKADIATMMAASICCFCCRRESLVEYLSCFTLQSCLQTQQQKELAWHTLKRAERNAGNQPGYEIWIPVFRAAPEVEVMSDNAPGATQPPSYTAQGKIILSMQAESTLEPEQRCRGASVTVKD